MEINENIVREIFKLAGIIPPENLSEVDVLQALVAIKEKQTQTSKQKTETVSATQNREFRNFDNTIEPDYSSFSGNNILVADDIGVVTYQLKVLLTNIEFNVQVAKDIFGALNLF